MKVFRGLVPTGLVALVVLISGARLLESPRGAPGQGPGPSQTASGSARSGALLPLAPTEQSITGRVERVVSDPTGHLGAIVLQDRTWLRLDPTQLSSTDLLRPGDQITASGIQILELPNRVLENVKVALSGRTILDQSLSSAQSAILPSQDSNDTAYLGGVVATGPSAQWMTDTSPLFSVAADHRGRVNRLLFQDGTMVILPANGRTDPARLTRGDRLTVSGVGRKLGSGMKWLCATNLTAEEKSDSPLIMAANPADGQWTTIEDSVHQLLLAPDGQIDGLYLDHQGLVRFTPLPAEDLAVLKPGTQVRASGPRAFNQLRTQLVYLPSSQRIVYLEQPFSAQANPSRSFGPPGLAPYNAEQIAERLPRVSPGQKAGRKLDSITEKGQIEMLVRNSAGALDAIVLTNGTTVETARVPDSELLSRLQMGQTISVQGPGGHYPQGNGLLAETIQIVPSGAPAG